MKHGPWTSGPRELLDHAKDHLAKATDVDNRFAMISVDNAVEVMVGTYLVLPRRVTGLSLTKKEWEERTRNFPTAIAALEELAPETVRGLPLGEIEYFHRIRNQLYHQGNVITVERDKVQRYLEQAELLMRRLFGAGPAARPSARAALSLEDICAKADRVGLGNEFRMILDAARKHNLYPRPYKHTVMYTPPSNHARMLLSVPVDPRDIQLSVYVGPRAFAEFYPVREGDVRSMLGPEGRRRMTTSDVHEFVRNLDRLFEMMTATRRERSKRFTLAEEDFFDILAQSASRNEVDVARRLMSDGDSLGTEIVWRQASFVVKLPDPGASGQRLTLFYVTKDGKLMGGWLANKLPELDLPREIGEEYFEQVAQLYDHCRVKRHGSGDLTWSRGILLSELGGTYDQFLKILADTIDRIKKASEAQASQSS